MSFKDDYKNQIESLSADGYLKEKVLKKIEEKEKKKIRQELSAELKDLVSNMQRVFGTKVNAIGNDKKGRIYIDYYTRDDLDRLAEILEFVKKSNINL